MTQDQNKKTLRHFQCRDHLWELFEQMSDELECSTDYLINEAMRQYARSRNYGINQRPVDAHLGGNVAHLPIPSLRNTAPPPRPQMPPAPPPPPRRAATIPGGGAATMQTLSRPPAPMASAAPPPPPGRTTPDPAVVSSAPPPPLTSGPAAAAASVTNGANGAATQDGRPSLYLVFNGQKIPVDKDEFIIGRGSKSADLPIKDGNISRRHAAVVFHNGYYFIKDLGSTNGIEYSGRRLESRRIEEGDVYRLCDYEVHFTYE